MNVEDLIGKPYAVDGQGPHRYNCAWLVVELMRRRGVDIAISDAQVPSPELAMRRILRADWIPVPRPYRGAVAFFSPAHVGMMLDSRRVIHAQEERGQVCIELLDSPHLRPCLVGFYEYAGGRA